MNNIYPLEKALEKFTYFWYGDTEEDQVLKNTILFFFGSENPDPGAVRNFSYQFKCRNTKNRAIGSMKEIWKSENRKTFNLINENRYYFGVPEREWTLDRYMKDKAP